MSFLILLELCIGVKSLYRVKGKEEDKKREREGERRADKGRD